MSEFKSEGWVWTGEEHGKNTRVEFFGVLEVTEGERFKLLISCDGDYTLYINGEPFESNQYGDHEHYKSYDELDITPRLCRGRNIIAVSVWYIGESTMRYTLADPGLLLRVADASGRVALEGKDMLCRISRAYENGSDKKITSQLGFSFRYDATRQDGWTRGEGEGFAPAVQVDKHCVMVERPNEKLRLGDKKAMVSLSEQDGGGRYIVDLGEETVGVPRLELFSELDGNEVTVSWGEHLDGGHVKRFIGDRDFSYVYVAKKGENVFSCYELRLGCRYLEVVAEHPIRLVYAGVIPQYYPAVRRKVALEDELDRRIYDTCVRTLELCMMEHYVDCPWREQALYAFDSRNQMLCGYRVFEGGNLRYARSNLLLIGKAQRIGGLLPICSPSGQKLTIPSFGLYYFLEMYEYMKYSGDDTLAREAIDELHELLSVYLDRRENGLVRRFGGKENWNFYDWSEHSSGVLREAEATLPDMMINALTVMALICLERMCEQTGREFKFAGEAEALKRRINETFYCEEDGYYTMLAGERQYTELCNSFAVLLGLADADVGKRICEAMLEGRLSPCSLSMRTFKYDAWLAVDRARYSEAILEEIRRDYGRMLDAGSTSVWETIDGASDFDGAGSLCHGWSAMPAYYYFVLGRARYERR